MTIVTWTAKHSKLTIYLTREEYAITVKWQEGIL